LTQQHEQQNEAFKRYCHNSTIDLRTTPTIERRCNTTKDNTLETHTRTTYSTQVVDTIPNKMIVGNAEVQPMNGLLVNRKKERVDLGRPFSILEHLQP
jgi:hypothetical protein